MVRAKCVLVSVCVTSAGIDDRACRQQSGVTKVCFSTVLNSGACVRKKSLRGPASSLLNCKGPPFSHLTAKASRM